MTVPALFVQGQPLKIGKRLGKGGEGEVYALENRPGHAIKFYTLSDLTSREAKILAMVKAQLSEHSRLVSFPSAIVTNQNGKFAGFVMKMVSGHHPIHHLYSILDRKTYFPSAQYPFLVRAATNVARAIADVHSRNCVVGDINHSGILVSDQAVVALIDADSFQISDGNHRHLCIVGVPEYTPPELQGKKLSAVERTPNHDAFGLAVMIFQLLCLGRHPFVGRYQQGEMPLERAITENRFAYSRRRQVGMSPPPGAVTLGDFPDYIASAFEAAFQPGGTRPTAAQWVAMLGQFEAGLRRCQSNSLHHHATEAAQCPWCRMEKTIGLAPFLPLAPNKSGGATFSGSSSTFDIAAIWRAIEAVQLPPSQAPSPLVPTSDIALSPGAIEAATKVTNKQAFGVACLLSAGVLLAAGQVHVFFILCTAGYGAYQVFARGGAGAKFGAERTREERQWVKTVEQWEVRCGGGEATSLKSNLAQARKELDGLPSVLKARLGEYQSKRQHHQLKAHLERSKISSATIKGIGPSLKAALRAWGIESAFEVDYNRVLQVDGIGNAKALELVTWRKMAENRFRFDPNPNAADTKEKDRITREIATRESQLKAQLQRGASDLRSATQRTLTLWKTIDPQVSKGYASLVRSKQDDDHVNAPIATQLSRFKFGNWALILILPMICFLIGRGGELPISPQQQTRSDYPPALEQPKTKAVTPPVEKLDPCSDKSWLEGALCREVALKRRAEAVDEALKATRNELDEQGNISLTQGQELWIRRRNLCESSSNISTCLIEAYDQRLSEINALKPVQSEPAQNSTQPSEPEAPNAIAAQPRLITSVGALISSADYPIAAARSGAQGRVTVELSIDASGRVSGCSILQSSGNEDLDGATCRLLTRRARYSPAQDSSGQSVPGSITSSINWRLPE